MSPWVGVLLVGMLLLVGCGAEGPVLSFQGGGGTSAVKPNGATAGVSGDVASGSGGAAVNAPVALARPTALHGVPSLRYANGEYRYSARITWEFPPEAVSATESAFSGLVFFACELEAYDGAAWQQAVSTTFCKPGSLTSFGAADAGVWEPGTLQRFRVRLLAAEDYPEPPWPAASPPSSELAVRMLVPGVPVLSTRCSLDFGIERSATSIPLHWKVDASGVDIQHFELVRSETGAEPWFTPWIVNFDEAAVSYEFVDAPLPSDATRYYRIRSAFSGGGFSAWSNIVKERSVTDREWCHTDRAAHDRAVDAVGEG